MLNSFIPSLLLLAPRSLHATLFTYSCWLFISKNYLSEVEAFVIVLFMKVWVVLQCLLKWYLYQSMLRHKVVSLFVLTLLWQARRSGPSALVPGALMCRDFSRSHIVCHSTNQHGIPPPSLSHVWAALRYLVECGWRCWPGLWGMHNHQTCQQASRSGCSSYSGI